MSASTIPLVEDDTQSFTNFLHDYFTEIPGDSCSEFLSIMQDFTDNRSGVSEVLARVETLLRGHPQLQVAFNALLPATHSIHIDDNCVTAPVLRPDSPCGGLLVDQESDDSIGSFVSLSPNDNDSEVTSFDDMDLWGCQASDPAMIEEVRLASAMSLQPIPSAGLDLIKATPFAPLRLAMNSAQANKRQRTTVASDYSCSSIGTTTTDENDASQANVMPDNVKVNVTPKIRQSASDKFIRKRKVQLVHINVQTSQLHRTRRDAAYIETRSGEPFARVNRKLQQQRASDSFFGYHHPNGGYHHQGYHHLHGLNDLDGQMKRSAPVLSAVAIHTAALLNKLMKEEKRRGLLKLSGIETPGKMSPELLQIQLEMDHTVEKVNSTKHRHRKGGPCPRCQVENQLRAAKRVFDKLVYGTAEKLPASLRKSSSENCTNN